MENYEWHEFTREADAYFISSVSHTYDNNTNTRIY